MASLIGLTRVELMFAPDADDSCFIGNMLEDKWIIIKERLEPVLDPGKFVGGTTGEERRLAFHPQEFYNFQAKSGGVSSQKCTQWVEWRMVVGIVRGNRCSIASRIRQKYNELAPG